MIEAVINRLQAQIAEFDGRVEGAAQFAELMRTKNLPQVTPAAHVLPLGLRGGQADASAGSFVQMTDQVIGILLIIRDQGAVAKRILANLQGFIDRIVAAVAGWAPPEAASVFRVTRGQMVSAVAGTILYQIDFSISEQLRITA